MPVNKLTKGDIAIAHIQKSGCSLLAGHYVWSRYFVVQVLSSTRDGIVKTYRDNPIASAASPVNRFVTVYSFPESFKHVAQAAFDGQALDFTGYVEKADLKAALEALASIQQAA